MFLRAEYSMDTLPFAVTYVSGVELPYSWSTKGSDTQPPFR